MIDAPLTLEEARRRQAALAAKLPLSATWTEIRAVLGVQDDLSPDLMGAVNAGAAQEDRDARALEDEEVRETTKLFLAWGARHWNASEKRRQKVTKGRPDSTYFFPSRGVALEWEHKRQVGGRYSDAQIEYRDLCRACGRPWGGGDRHDAAAWLIAQGWAERGPTGVLEPIRTPPPPTQEVSRKARGVTLTVAPVEG